MNVHGNGYFVVMCEHETNGATCSICCDRRASLLRVCAEHSITSAEQLRERLNSSVTFVNGERLLHLTKERDELREEVAKLKELYGESCGEVARLRAHAAQLAGRLSVYAEPREKNMIEMAKRLDERTELGTNIGKPPEVGPSATATAPPVQRGIIIRCDSGFDD